MKKIAQKIINALVNLFIKIKSMPAWKEIFKFASIKIQLATQKIISLNSQLTQFAQPRLQNLIRKIIRNNEFILKTKTTQISLYIGIYLIISLLLHFINGFVEDSKNRSARMRPVSVVTSPINSGQITVIQTALGTVTPRNTVIVHSQVSGVLSKVFFREGDLVKAGQLLALIDPRPFEASLKQAEGTLSKDKALLANAQLDLKRYDTLLKQDSISHQVYATQKALVDQYKGNVLTDEGLVSNAKLQLEFAHISSPINGRVGLRNVDPGNLVQPGDANGLFAITQLQPTTVLFSVPQDVIPSFKKFLEEPPSLENFDTKSAQKVDESSQNLRNLDSTIKQKYSHRKDHANSEANSEVSANDHQTSSTQKIVIPVEAWNPDNTKKLATGYLESIDNQIDITTGTVKLRAIFPNEDMSLFPNQFVNIRVVLNVLTDVLTMPVPAIQRGTPGTFVYRLNNNNTVSVVPIKLGPIDGNNVQVIEGLAAGNIVVVDGTDKLRNGAKVIVGDPTTSSPETKRWREGAKGRASP